MRSPMQLLNVYICTDRIKQNNKKVAGDSSGKNVVKAQNNVDNEG
jgi:hypothetical protein